jgi:putative transposase
MDFVSDTLADGRTFRMLTTVDDYSRQCLAIEVDFSLPGARLVRVLERLIGEFGKPLMIRTDNVLTAERQSRWEAEVLGGVPRGAPRDSVYGQAASTCKGSGTQP